MTVLFMPAASFTSFCTSCIPLSMGWRREWDCWIHLTVRLVRGAPLYFNVGCSCVAITGLHDCKYAKCVVFVRVCVCVRVCGRWLMEADAMSRTCEEGWRRRGGGADRESVKCDLLLRLTSLVPATFYFCYKPTDVNAGLALCAWEEGGAM